ncbi:MAG: PEGA domain-containing protein, partial [Myxococcales bacterium]|nr:PEGA domain-containing protein [Myxococcales bacterium]
DRGTELLRSLGAPGTESGEKAIATGAEAPRARAAYLPALIGGLVAATLLSAAVAAWAILSRPEERAALEPASSPPLALPAPTQPSPAEGVEPAEPAEPVADPSTTGTVWVSSEPPGAEISLNSTPTGELTPAQITGLWPGNYRVTLRLEGHRTYRTRTRLEAGRVAQVSATLEPEGGVLDDGWGEPPPEAPEAPEAPAPTGMEEPPPPPANEATDLFRSEAL